MQLKDGLDEHSTFVDGLAKKNLALQDIQSGYLQIFGKYDLEKSLIWLFEEMGEVVAAIRKGHSKTEISGEIGDLCTWIINLANILGIDLAASLNSTLHKEYKRQIGKYGRLKYFARGSEAN
jgi:NTP pyrophosphatase (non-canonical NTP hydrolase)